MKKILIPLVTLLVMVSCNGASSLPSRIESFVDQVEKRCEKYSSEDWDKSAAKFEEMTTQYEENYETYTSEERTTINKAIGRYSALALKFSVGELGSELENYGNEVGGMIDGFLGAFDEE